MGELVADQGTIILNDTTEVIKTIDRIVVLENTEFTYINVNNHDVTSDYIADKTTPVRAGAIITPIDDLQFNGVQLTSGSVVLVLG